MMKKVTWMAVALVGFLSLAGLAPAANVTLDGAGASFPYPLYSQWAYKYNSLTGVKINYQSIGSGGGIAQIKAKTVDFGGTDKPLKVDELNQSGLIQFPMVMGGVVPVVNVAGVAPGQLRLSGKVLAQIFLGKISQWDDPAQGQAAFPGHHRSAPDRGFRHHLYLHQLPGRDLSGLERESRGREIGEVAGAQQHRRQRQ
jgi:phosphate transport system substrate-binding protein